LTPIIVVVATYLADLAQTLFNADLDGAELAAYLGSVAIPVGTVIAIWLFNRGKHELAKLEAENLAALTEVDKEAQAETNGR
jgi:hypothetical protein